jgi:tetratricopeptide (TPR) repeat protein
MQASEETFRQAAALHEQGRLGEAEKLYEQIRLGEPDNFEALHRLAIVSLQRGELEEALRRVEVALRVDPSSLKALSNKGSILVALRRNAEALVSYDAALALDPDNPDTLYNRANAHLALENTRDALQGYARALALRPGDALMLGNYAIALMRSNRLDDALAALDRAILLTPDVASLHYNRGSMLMGLQRTEEALASFDRTLAPERGNADAHCHRTVALINLQRFREALHAYDAAMALNANSEKLRNISRDNLVLNGSMATPDLDRAKARGQAKTELERLFWDHQGRLAHKWQHYLAIHDRLLSPFRRGFPTPDGLLRPLKFLEIGLWQGGSLQLWRKFLGPEALIFGIDIDPSCRAIDDPDLNVRIGSQADPAFLLEVAREMGGIDVLIDDGSHVAEHQRTTFDTLFPILSQGGLYIVEDTHTAYWREWGGGYRREGSFIEFAKSLVDDMHVWYHGVGHGVRPSSTVGNRGDAARVGSDPVERDVFSVAFFDSIVVIEKQRRADPYHVLSGKGAG